MRLLGDIWRDLEQVEIVEIRQRHDMSPIQLHRVRVPVAFLLLQVVVFMVHFPPICCPSLFESTSVEVNDAIDVAGVTNDISWSETALIDAGIFNHFGSAEKYRL